MSNQFTESVCAKFSAPAVFNPTKLGTRFAHISEILKASREGIFRKEYPAKFEEKKP